jgi:hypothetical protein
MVKSGSAHRDKPEGKRALGKPMHRWEVTEMDLRGIGFGGVTWIHWLRTGTDGSLL